MSIRFSIVLFAIFYLTNLSSASRMLGQHDVNIFGNKLEVCSTNPMTGWYRDGYCKTDDQDQGTHTVACVISQEFLDHQKARGNDLTSAMKAGDKWCVCALRWLQAYQDNKQCKVILNATNKKTLEYIDMKTLEANAYKN